MFFFFFFKQKTAYEMQRGLVGSEMCIRDSINAEYMGSYKSVTLESMAQSFGISTVFLDKELSTFIAAGRINCKIDKVAGIIESNRPDERLALYQNIVKEGDFLLNRIQKLSRAIELQTFLSLIHI
eukprot:TRINITY_DN15717_c0_g1_i1.p1 TRINITY_DN15717_c0_g1~~TRINITY_DN15717_c0_g1_i1.p1  ORF type:complete len:126 (+),score=44.29 TRINITY_DN15717_c0_g1_i1:78-455(+)